METKWITIMIAVIVGTLMFSVAFENQQQGECRVAGISKGLAAADIEEVCGK